MTTIEEITAVSDDLVAAFARLIPQLSSSSAPPDAAALQAVIDDPGNHLLIARADDGTIVGTTTLVVFTIPTGVRAWIEDVIVDTSAAGHGVGTAITGYALEVARGVGAKTVDLTSRPSREAANHMYKRIGFEPRDTNVYRFGLE